MLNACIPLLYNYFEKSNQISLLFFFFFILVSDNLKKGTGVLRGLLEQTDNIHWNGEDKWNCEWVSVYGQHWPWISMSSFKLWLKSSVICCLGSDLGILCYMSVQLKFSRTHHLLVIAINLVTYFRNGELLQWCFIKHLLTAQVFFELERWMLWYRQFWGCISMQQGESSVSGCKQVPVLGFSPPLREGVPHNGHPCTKYTSLAEFL